MADEDAELLHWFRTELHRNRLHRELQAEYQDWVSSYTEYCREYHSHYMTDSSTSSETSEANRFPLTERSIQRRNYIAREERAWREHQLKQSSRLQSLAALKNRIAEARLKSSCRQKHGDLVMKLEASHQQIEPKHEMMQLECHQTEQKPGDVVETCSELQVCDEQSNSSAMLPSEDTQNIVPELVNISKKKKTLGRNKKERKGKKKRLKKVSSEEEKKEITGDVEPDSRMLLLAENVLIPELMECFKCVEELPARDPPVTPEPPDPGFSWTPECVVFKDFHVGVTYRRTLRITNVGVTAAKCLLHRVEMSEIEVTAGDASWLHTGMSYVANVSFKPCQSTADTVGSIVFLTYRAGSTKKELHVLVRCIAERANPAVVPTRLVLRLPDKQCGVFHINNSGGKSCSFRICRLADAVTEDEDEELSGQKLAAQLLDECLDNVFEEFRFDQKYHITLPARNSVLLPVTFQPHESGFREECFLFRFDSLCPEMFVIVSGESAPPPLQVMPSTVDLQVCCVDGGVCQGSFALVGTARMTVRLQLPRALHRHVAVYPTEVFVQPGEQHHVSVRLCPSANLITDAPQFYNTCTEVLRFPVCVQLKDHSLLQVHVQAVVTTAFGLTFQPTCIDWGTVTVFETVVHVVELTNNSRALHKFGFIHVPQCVSVQPGDGFGTVLPGETISLQLLYSPSADNVPEHVFTMHCTTVAVCATECSLAIHCKACVIEPSCRLSCSSLTLPPTPCGSFSTAHVSLQCHQEETRFEFKSNSDDITVMPCMGLLSAGQVMRLTVLFCPRLRSEDVESEQKNHMEEEGTGRGKGKKKKRGKKEKDEDGKEAEASLFPAERSVEPHSVTTTVTCVLQQGEEQPSELRLNVICPVVRPDFLLGPASHKLEFGPIAVGMCSMQHASVQNISAHSLYVRVSLLNPVGPFWCLPAWSCLDPEHVLNIPVTFLPEEECPEVQEYLEIRAGCTVTSLLLSACAICPQFSFQPDVDTFQFTDKRLEFNLWVSNACAAPLLFMLHADDPTFIVQPKQLLVPPFKRESFKMQYTGKEPSAAKYKITLGRTKLVKEIELLSGKRKEKKK